MTGTGRTGPDSKCKVNARVSNIGESCGSVSEFGCVGRRGKRLLATSHTLLSVDVVFLEVLLDPEVLELVDLRDLVVLGVVSSTTS